MLRRLVTLERFLPSLVMAAGVTLLTAGVLSYVPLTVGEPQLSSAASDAGDPRFSEPATAAPSVGSIRPTGTPIEIGPGASVSPRPATTGYATRVRVPSLDIDLPIVSGALVVAGDESGYPLCDVAMYMPDLAQPGERGTTYLYAHAQRGMFLPLLRASTVDDGAQMIGALVEVYTSANELHLYEITRVKRHATDLSIVSEAGDTEQLVLQTSEGPAGTVPKLQVVASPVSVIRAAPADAQPSPQPRVCAPGS
jgi:sortase (surface protein transpeptidase)